jgi:hypothetical protein
LIPPGSQVAKDLSPRYLDEQGRIKMPQPPTGNADPSGFNDFVRVLEKSTGSPISRVVMHAELWAQSYTPG